jgi:hypothetical protein
VVADSSDNTMHVLPLEHVDCLKVKQAKASVMLMEAHISAHRCALHAPA